MSKKCPICESKQLIQVKNNYKSSGSLEIFRCDTCDFEFLNSWDDVNHVKSLYEDDKYIFSHNVQDDPEIPLKFNEYEERFEWIKSHLHETKTLLEVGCGDGKFLRMVRDHVKLADGIELSPPQVKRLREDGFTCYDVMLDEMEPPRQYDIICMFAVLEHVPLVVNFLSALKKYMHQDTQVFIEVPNLNDALVSGFDLPVFRDFYYRPVHLYYFTPKSLGKLLEISGFRYDLHTSQQASITNHFHWMHKHKGQPNGNYMASVVAPCEVSDKLPIRSILEEVDDHYRGLLRSAEMGDLLSAHVSLKKESFQSD